MDRAAIYETTADRFVTELVLVHPKEVDLNNKKIIYDFRYNPSFPNSFVLGKNGEHYKNGYTQIYYNGDAIIMQERRGGSFLSTSNCPFKARLFEHSEGYYDLTLYDFDSPNAFDINKIKVYTRYDSEWKYWLSEKTGENSYKVKEGAENEFNSIWCESAY